MNQEFNNAEMIEAYLRNELSPLERASFEKRISQDPLLQNELTLQSDIINSLQGYRKAELKQRLNRIDISDSSNFLRNAGLFAALTAFLGLGTYIYYNQHTDIEPGPPVSSPSQTESQIPSDNNQEAKDISASLNIDTAGKTSPETEPEVITATPSEPEKKSSPVRTELRPNAKPSVSSSEPTGSKAIRPENEKKDLQREKVGGNSHSSANDTAETSKEADKPMDNGRVKSATGKSPNGLNVTYADSHYKFHYKYTNDNLELFGDFSKGIKKLKLNDQMYLYFEENFYPINNYQPKIAPLVKVTDPALLEQLMKTLKQD
jgi:hypothetical protein